MSNPIRRLSCLKLAGYRTTLTVLASLIVISAGCSESTNPIYQSIRAPKPQEDQVAEEPPSQTRAAFEQPQAAGAGNFDARQQSSATPNYYGGNNETPVFAASDQLAPPQSFSNSNRAGNSNSPTFAGAGNSGGASPPNVAPPRPGRSNGGSTYGGNRGDDFGDGGPSTGGVGGPATGGVGGPVGNGSGSNGGQSSTQSVQSSGGSNNQGSYFNEARLLRPVALPQTGPNGTMMSFNIQYEFTKRKPAASDQYYLVIRGKRGFREEWHLTDLDVQGGFTAIVDGWKPEFGPFSATMEQALDGGGLRNPISQAAAFP